MNGKSDVVGVVDLEQKLSGQGNLLEVKFADLDYSANSLNQSKCSEDDSSDDDSDDQIKSKIPDGGWGWMVVLASFTISMIADGVSFSFGLIYIELLNEFGATKSQTSWIGSLFIAVPLLSGPIMSSLVDKYGCRVMTVVGGIIATVGFALSAYATSIYTMYITFGVIAGLGLGMNYVTAVVSVAYWFEKRRNFATGLGACGTGFGTFIYAPITQYLLNEFGWRGTTLLLAGTFLNICVCGMLMRDPDWLIERDNNSKLAKSSKRTSSVGSVSGKSALEDFEELRERFLKAGTDNDEYFLQNLVTSIAAAHNSSSDDDGLKCDHHRSDFNLPTFVKQNEKVPLEVLEQLGANTRLYNLILENYPSLLTCRSTSDARINMISNSAVSTVRVPVTVSMKLKKAEKPKLPAAEILNHATAPLIPPVMSATTATVLPMPRVSSMHCLWKKSAQQPGYLRNIKMHRNSVMYRGAMLNIRKYRLRASSCPDMYRNSMTTLAKETEDCWYHEWLELIKSMFDFSYFSDLNFLLLSLSTILLFTWFIVPYYYLPEHMKRLNYSESEISSVLSMIGITNTIGMVFLGWAGDKQWMNVIKTYAICLVLCGISCGGMYYFSNNYVILLAWSALFGVFFASSFSFTPMVVVELLSLEQFTTAYGLVLLCQGCGHLWGPPLAGYLFDITGSWEQSFTQACIWIIVAGLLVGIIPYTGDRSFRFSQLFKTRGDCEAPPIENKDCIKV